MKKTLFQRTFSILSFFVLIAIGGNTFAQVVEKENKYYVYLIDKAGSQFDPFEYFDSKAITRRQKLGINLYDSSDFPVSPQYRTIIKNRVNLIKQESRWLNMVTVMATYQQIEELGGLHFVKNIESGTAIAQLSGAEVKGSDSQDFALSESQIEMVKAQLARMDGGSFKEQKLDGSGIRVAILDAGFRSYKTNPAFEHLRSAQRILKTWDFVKNNKNVDGYNNHGTNVLSCVAGMQGGQPIGLATGAEFLLARTETWTEFFAEEENWLAAAEWADKNGADIINSSLGYTYHRYFRYNMDGKTAMVSRAANMAASKGILVVNSAGNEGADAWKNMGAPADADSVLSIGGIHHRSGIHTSFSSFGPTWDKRLKPNLTAYGHVIASGPKGYHSTQGTSFSSPLVAGFAACAWQADTNLSNMDVFRKLEQSGDLYPYFDYAHGFGVPQAGKYLGLEDESTTASIHFQENKKNGTIRIELADTSTKAKASSSSVWDGKPRTSFPNYIFYHIENKKGYLDKYVIVDLTGTDKEELFGNPLIIDKKDYQLPFIIRAFYAGHFIEIKVDK